MASLSHHPAVKRSADPWVEKSTLPTKKQERTLATVYLQVAEHNHTGASLSDRTRENAVWILHRDHVISKPVNSSAADPKKSCIVCDEAFGEYTASVNLGLACGGAAQLCHTCIQSYLKAEINSDNVVPWIKSPHPDLTDQCLPPDVVLLAGPPLVLRFLESFTSKKLARVPGWVVCHQCHFGQFDANYEVTECSHCRNQLAPRRAAVPLLVQAVNFTPGQAPGDFTCLLPQEWLLDPPTTPPAELPVFNNNVSNWTQAMLHPTRRQQPGGGNAAIRPYECNNLTVGIPTGADGEGFKSLTQMHTIHPDLACILQGANKLDGPVVSTQQIIDAAYKRIVELLAQRLNVDTVYYSGDPKRWVNIGNGTHVQCLGTGIFHVTPHVIDYITQKLNIDLPRDVNALRGL